MKILFLTSRLPFPPIGGDKLRTFNFIKYLSRKHEVTVLSFYEHEDELSDCRKYSTIYHKLIPVKLTRSRSYVNCLQGLFSSVPLQVHYYRKGEVRNLVAAELKKGYDAIFCHLIRMAQYLPCGDEIFKVIDFTDAISMNYERSKAFRRGMFSVIDAIESKRVFKYEKEIIRRADKAIFISETDCSYLKSEDHADKMKIVRNGVDMETFTFNGAQYDPNKIVFMGNMRTFPNADAAVFLGQRIFPILRERHPGLKLYIVGQQPTREVRELHDGEHIFVTGYVESVVEDLRSAAVMVAPMRVGAGMKNKILEAMAVGTPVVTTRIGAAGLDARGMIVADSPEEIARATLMLLHDKELRRQKSLSARSYVEKTFAWEKQLVQLDAILQWNGKTEQMDSVRNRDLQLTD